MNRLRLIRLDAPVNEVIAYTTDAAPLFTEHRGFFEQHHSEKRAFADGLCNDATELVTAAGVAARELFEAKTATEHQTDTTKRASEAVTYVQYTASFVVLESQSQWPLDAELIVKRVRAALRVAPRTRRKGQSAIRVTLTSLDEGLEKLRDLFPRFPDLAEAQRRVRTAVAELGGAIGAQAKEQAEASEAEARVDALVERAIVRFRRAIALINIDPARAPAALVEGLRTLEGRHPAVFHAREQQAVDPALPNDDEPS